MKNVITVLLSIFSFSSFSLDGYKLDMSVLLNGEIVSRPKLTIEQGKKGTLIQESALSKRTTHISIVATEGEALENEGILLKLEIAHKEGKSKKIVARPRILVFEGTEAQFITANNDGSKSLTLNVTATRVEL